MSMISPVSRKVKPYDSILELLCVEWLPMILQASFRKQMSNVDAPHVAHYPPHSTLLCHDQNVGTVTDRGAVPRDNYSSVASPAELIAA